MLLDIATREVDVTIDTVVDFGLPTGDPDVLLDVSGNNRVTAHDALLVINALNRLSQADGELINGRPRAMTDVNGDGLTTARDALMIINHLERGRGIAELVADLDSVDEKMSEAAVDSVLASNLF